MNLTYFNEHTSCLHPLIDFIYIRPLLLLSDTFYMHSPQSSIIMSYINYDKWTYGDIVVNFKLFVPNADENDYANKLDKMAESWKKLKPSHSSEYVRLKNETRRIFESCKLVTYEGMKSFMDQSQVNEVLPFFTAGIFKPADPPWVRHFEVKYDSYVRFFEKALLTPDNYMVLPDIVSQYLRIYSMSSKPGGKPPAKNTTDVVALKLVRLPILSHLASDELEFTRKNVLRALEPLGKALKELDEKLIELDFGPESFTAIKAMLQDHMAQQANDFQTKVNNELFIQGAWNKAGNGSYTDICLGITSLENLIRYYQLANILEEARAHKVKQAISRDLPPESCILFFYFDTMPKELTLMPDGDSID